MLNTQKTYYDFGDVLIKPQKSEINSRQDISLRVNMFSKYEKKSFKNWFPVPIMSANMDTITDIEMAFELLKRHWVPVLHKYVSKEDISSLFDKIDQYNVDLSKEDKLDYRNLFVSRGATLKDKLKLKERLAAEPRIRSICIDIANGHRASVLDYIKDLKESVLSDKHILMVGNVGSSDMVEAYESVGVDIIKGGIGPGSACITRIKTGVGVPQISLIDELFKAKTNILICSDGGCKVEGDLAKAFVAGADFVMIGGMLSGHKESPGEIQEIGDKKFKIFSGMAAKESQHEGVPEYGTEEGKTILIPYRGKILHTLINIEGGLRSTCTYVNSLYLKDIVHAQLILTNVQENKIYS